MSGAKSEVTMLTRAHSKLGASSSDRWTHCPGSVRLCEEVPKSEGGQAALEGTAAHRLAEVCFTTGKTANSFIGKEKLLGEEFTAHNIKCTKEMCRHVQDYVDFVLEKAEELGGELIIEKKFHLSHIHPDLYGTADAVIVVPFGPIWVIDFKYGEGHLVEVEGYDANDDGNSQLLYYAVGAAFDQDCESVTLCIVQPRMDHEDGPIRTKVVEPRVLRNFAKRLRHWALATEREDAPLLPGRWCQWCDAAGVCPALHRSAVEVIGDDFKDPQLPEPRRLSDEQLERVIRYSKMIEKWFDSVREYARERALKGDVIPGLKVVAGRGSRKWKDEEKAKGRLESWLGNDAYKVTLLSVAQAEERLGATKVADLWEKIEGNPTIAHESDRRQMLVPDAKKDFADNLDFEASEDDF